MNAGVDQKNDDDPAAWLTLPPGSVSLEPLLEDSTLDSGQREPLPSYTVDAPGKLEPPQIPSYTVDAPGKLEPPQLWLKLTPTQKAGMCLLAGVGAVIALMLTFICFDLLINRPNMRSIAIYTQDMEEILTIYEGIITAQTKSSIDLFDTIVIRALLPVFATILGYVFGSRMQSSEKNEES